MTEVTVVIERCAQIDADSFKQVRYSRNFSVDCSLKEILSWAKAMGIKDASINDLQFADYTGSSI